MHKLRVFIVISVSLLSLVNCNDKIKNATESGIYSNHNKQFVIIKSNKLLYPFEAKVGFKFKDDGIIFNDTKYDKLVINTKPLMFDSIEVSYNTDNYETSGIKEFDAKIFRDSIIFYDVETNITKKIELDKDFKKWLNFSLYGRKMNNKDIDKTDNKFIIGLIKYENRQSENIYSNAFNSENNLQLFMSILITYLSINKEKGTVIQKVTFESLDSLEEYIDKNKIGIKRVPLPPHPPVP